MAISQPPFQSTLVDADDRVQTPWAQWFSQLQPLLQSVVASGPTSGRPTQNVFIGYPYFDTTIDQMVYWNGVIWVTYAPSTTGTSILKGNGSGGFNNAVAGVDFAPATSGNAILYGNGSGGFSSVSIGLGVTFAGGVLSATGSGGTVTAVTGTAPIASSGGNTPAISISQAGASTNGYLSSTDWNIFNSKAPATSGTAILYGDGAGGFSNVTIGSGVTFVAGTLSATGSGGTVTAVTGSGNIASSGGTTPNITFTGTLPIANGGTNGTATPTAGAVAVGNGTQYAFTAAGSAGQVLTSNGSTVPTWATVATGIGTTGYWGSFWDTTNQTAASTTVAYLITLNSTDADSNGVSIVSSSRITFAYAGAYNLQFSAQFVNTDTQIHNAQVWLRLNGTDVTDSMGTVAIQQKHGSIDGVNIVSWNYVLKLSAGDYLQLAWNVDSTQVSLQTLPAGTSPTHPESPSVIVTATPVTEVGIGYYNLTSVSSVAIATGSKTFTTNLSNISTAFTVGTRVRVAYVTTPANYMEGVITSFSGTTLVVNVDSIGGSGTYANWTISVAGIQGSNGVTSITGTANQVIASASTGAVTLSLPQNINSGAAPTFLGTNFTGTASININGTVGATTATTGKFTTLEYTSTLTGGTGIVAIGTNQIYKDASGNVGIGTSSPVTSLTIQAASGNGIKLYDASAGAGGTWPCIESIGSRGDGNGSFGGRFGAGSRRNDGTAIPTGWVLGHYAFGGQWGTGTTYNQTNFLYSASVVGVSEGSFTSATAMPTALVFSTGSTGTSLQSINVVYGTERMRITSTGGVNIGASTDPGLGNLKIVGAIIVGAVTATSAAAPTIASATTIAPTKAITFISGVTPIVTITPPSPISLGGGTITLIPTGIFTTTIAGNIALASTAVIGRALTMTYDVTTTKWYPSY